MELTIKGTPEEIKKALQAIGGSEEYEGKTITIKSNGTLFINGN